MPFDIPSLTGVVIPVLVVLAVLFYSFRILREYERGVVFMLGRLWRVKGPGLVIVIPFVQQMVRVDLRTRVLANWDAGLAAKEVAAKFRVSRSWVNRLVQRRRETGEVVPRGG